MPKKDWIVMQNEPKFSAYREAEEGFRLDRLRMAWGYAVAVADRVRNHEFPTKVAELHDHKGVLTVSWNVAPTDGEKDCIDSAWKSGIGDPQSCVEHEVIK
jgi:hypothetical protein